MTGEVILRADDVAKHFRIGKGPLRPGADLRAVDGVSLEVHAGETLGIVGESGCGKSTLGRCVVRLTELTSGRVTFAGRDISTLSRRQLRPVRKELQLVFQDPYTSLNPRRRVNDILSDPLEIHGYGDRRKRERRVRELLEVVGLNATHADRFPHEFSGGQRQRVGIARALAMDPKVIVADEPVSALDVSIQAQVLNLFHDLQDELGLTYVFIAHDLGVVRHVSTRIAVMYLGEVVELAPAEELYEQPAHPYTQALLAAAPEVDTGEDDDAREQVLLKGDIPTPLDKPSGCAFRTRCPYAQDRCAEERPLLQVRPRGDAEGGTGEGGQRYVACHFPLA
ncbi:dipeptide ABC transporter ATP-binding protein [Nocardioides sp. KR10-350]|uniref:ABC transporter ATP-binding protein n=1 Tax=Nocardioides cheoyonin TaxID=3156615 RepID=UPI0032B45BA1